MVKKIMDYVSLFNSTYTLTSSLRRFLKIPIFVRLYIPVIIIGYFFFIVIQICFFLCPRNAALTDGVVFK
jgi:hypothetical protein